MAAFKIGVPLLLLALSSLSSASPFRFMGEGEGKTDFIGGEMGLLNAVPRMGKRVMGGNPFDSRFRFRFNNWLANSRLNGNAGFRFQGGQGDGGYQLRKRKRAPPSALVGGEASVAPLSGDSPSALPVDSGLVAKEVNMDKVGGGVGGVAGAGDGDENHLAWYAVADEYWKEYLNDLARKAVIEKMAEMELQSSAPAEGVPTPLAQYYARNPKLQKPPPPPKLADTEQKYPRLLPVMRSNF